MNGNVFLAISEVTAVEVHTYAFKDVLSVPISGRSRCMGRILFFKCKGKSYYCAVELPSQKTAVTMKMTTTSMLVLGTVGLQKTCKVVVTLGVENKSCRT